MADKLNFEVDKYPYHCSACGKGYLRQKDNFNACKSPYYNGNGGYLTMCKNCLDKAWKHYTNDIFGGDSKKGMELVCATLNIYWDELAWANAKKNPSPTRSTASLYFSKLNLNQTDKKGNSFTDTVAERLADKGSLFGIEVVEKVQSVQSTLPSELPEPKEVDKEIERRFGKGFKFEEYEALQDEYEDWIEKYGKPEDKRIDELYKSACYQKINYLRAVQSGDSNVGVVAKAYRETIDGFTTDLEKMRREREDATKVDPLGKWIADIEKYTPAEYFADKEIYKDNDGIGSYVSRFIFRPLKNLLTGSKDMDKEFSIGNQGEA